MLGGFNAGQLNALISQESWNLFTTSDNNFREQLTQSFCNWSASLNWSGQPRTDWIGASIGNSSVFFHLTSYAGLHQHTWGLSWADRSLKQGGAVPPVSPPAAVVLSISLLVVYYSIWILKCLSHSLNCLAGTSIGSAVNRYNSPGRMFILIIWVLHWGQGGANSTHPGHRIFSCL